ncbi:MAG: hypothetical protein IJ333_00280 [Clostridia bacterium]|nr:hypothetical protein [Clostridia bacterium]
MAKKQMNQQDTLNGRISILFFYSVLMCLFLWAERFAHYRYDYVFRKMLPWVLPVLLCLCVAGLVWLLLKTRRQKDTKEKVFSASFGAYLMVAPTMAVLLPLLSYLGQGVQLFKLATEAVFYLLIGYFIAYTVYYKVKPAAGLLAWAVALQVALVIYFYEMQLSPATGILNAPEFGYLTPVGSALVTGALVAVITVGVYLLGKVDRSWMKKWIATIPAVLSVLFLAVTVIVSFSFQVRLILLLSFIGLQVIWFAVSCFLIREK